MRDSVTLHMAAPAERIWPLVADVTNTRRFSAETFDAEWLDGATGPAVGVRFRGHVRRNGWWPPYWSVCRIDVCDSGREFAFTVGVAGRPVNTWRNRLEPNGDGTDVTESFELQDRWWTRRCTGRWPGGVAGRPTSPTCAPPSNGSGRRQKASPVRLDPLPAAWEDANNGLFLSTRDMVNPREAKSHERTA